MPHDDKKPDPTYMSIFLALDISFPFKPAAMKTSPSHRIKQYVNENAIPLNAKDATKGSPSPLIELAMIPRHVAVIAQRLNVSALLRTVIMIDLATCFWT